MNQSIIKICALFFLLFLVVTPVHHGFAHEGEVLGETYTPEIKPENFSAEITNKYVNLPIGKRLTYQATVEEGRETIETEVLPDTKVVMGIETRIYLERILLNQVLVRETEKYLAQDTSGDVWYFGESANNYVEGVVDNQDGSWLAGENEAQPGIWIQANPVVAVSFKQKFLHDIVEDTSEVVSISETVETPSKTYTDCVQTFDTTPIDPLVREHKYYCPEAGALVLAVNLETGKRSVLLESAQSQPLTAATPVDSIKEKTPIPDVALKILGGMLLAGAGILLARKHISQRK